MGHGSGQACGGQHKSRNIKLCPRLCLHFAQEHDGQENTYDTDRDVDKEDQLPVHISDKVAAKRRTNGGCQQGGNAQQTAGQPSLVRRKLAVKQRNGQWKKSGSPYSLQNAKDDQYGQAPGQTAES